MIMKLAVFVSLQMIKKYESLAGSEIVIENGNVFIMTELFSMRKAQLTMRCVRMNLGCKFDEI